MKDEKTTHPEQGVLSTEEVTFVNELYEKIEQYLPEGTGQPLAVV